ncbi:MAG: outer membrane protein assembly factor BamA [Gemmataceae bacterium]|nr:outer membrane protein assembly factor BamA [Gemmataceae bacterium]
MSGTANVTDKVPSPAWYRLLVLAGLVAAAGLLASTAWAQAPQEPVLVGDVVVHGLRTISQDQVKAHLKTIPGREYNQAVLEDDIRRLAETRWFQRIHPVRFETLTDGRLNVHIVVEEPPTVVREVIYKNAHHAKPADLDEVSRVKRGAPLNPSLNVRACYEIQEFYRKKGRLLANCTLEEGRNPGDQRVVFNISEGPVLKIRAIRFTGNHTLATAGRLKTQIDSRKAWTPLRLFTGDYHPPVVENDALKLEEYYKANGYLDARVTREVILNEDMRSVDVVFHIHEGMRYRVQDVTVEGPKQLNRDLVQSILRVKKDDLYSEPAVENDLRNIQDLYGYRGYQVLADKKLFVPDPEKEPGVVRVHYDVVERGPAKVGTIEVHGNTVTKDRVIRRVLQLYPGQTLSFPAVRQAEKDLMRLGIFETNPEKGTRPTIVVSEPESPDNPYRNVDVFVTEQPTGSLMFGLGVNSDAGLVGSIVLNEKNFDILRPPTSIEDIFNGRAWRGGGQEFRAEAVPGTQLQRYTIALREPYLFDLPLSLSLSGYYYDRLYNEYTERRVGTRATLGYQLNRYWSITGGARLENVSVRDVSPFAPPDLLDARGDSLLFAPRVSVVRDDRDSFLRPTEGGQIEGSFEQVLGDYTFPVVSLEASRYFTTFQRPDGSGRHVVALRSQVAWAGDDAPVFERFYAGGFRSLRGFQFRGVGPNINGFMVGGNFMFLNSVEYQVPIKANDQLYLVAFVDSGTVEQDVELTNYRVSAGFGVRVTVPMMGPVPIALDFGFPIVKAEGDREQIFAFYVGLFR